PNLGYVKTVMIGVRNSATGATASRCVEIWANELRLTGLNEQGGYAAVGRMDFQLADLGSLSIAGNYSSIGFGGLDQNLSERSLDETKGFDVAGNFELSRFLPEQWALRLPLYAAYSKTVISPKFDPYDLDIPLSEKIANASTTSEKEEIKELAQNVTEIKNPQF
ncbi:MAG: hypothetical protein HC892_17105, partial [Saprospiraceae bacterium]|nr:hypothetical protein [Saprospiraceae bacterium]